MTVGIAYAMGTGGHLVGAIVLNMLTRSPIRIMPDGSVHSYIRPHLFQHNLAKVGEDLVLIHSRDLKSVAELYEHTIYISFEESDVDLIARRFVSKRSLADEFDIYKGHDWPSFADVKDNVPQWILDEIVAISARTLREWVWTKPNRQVFEIRFDQLSSGEYLEPLAAYLGVNVDLDYIRAALNEYDSLQLK